MKTYSKADVKMILEWVDKYFEVNTLITNVICGNNLAAFPTIPSFENELEYQRLRFWFLKNQDDFVPIWADFCVSRGRSTECAVNIDKMGYRKNPFLYYYSPDNLLDLINTIGFTITVDIWNPDEQILESALNITQRFSRLVVHLRYWIGEFAENGS